MTEDKVATAADIKEAKAAAGKALRRKYKFVPKENYERKSFCKYLDSYGDAKDYSRKVIENPNNAHALTDYGRHIYGDEGAMYRRYKGDTAAMTQDATSMLEMSMQAVADYVLYGDNLNSLLNIIGTSDKKKKKPQEKDINNILLSMKHFYSRPLDRKDPEGKGGREDPDHDARVNLIKRAQNLKQIVEADDAGAKLEAMKREVFNEVQSSKDLDAHEKRMIEFFSDRRDIIEEHFARIYTRDMSAFYNTVNYATAREVIRKDFELIEEDLRLDHISEDRIADNKRDLLAPDAEVIAQTAFKIDDKLNKDDLSRSNKKKKKSEEGKKIRRGQGIPR